MPEERDAQSEMLRGMEELSTRFAYQSTLLSELLYQAEEFLGSLPGRVEVATDWTDDGTRLVFKKVRNSWALVYECRDEEADGVTKEYAVQKLPVSGKAIAALRLPALYAQLQSVLRTRLSVVEKAVEALGGIDFLDFDLARGAVEQDGLTDGIEPTQEEGGLDEIPF